MKISGKYESDGNFITVYTDDTLYTIARATGEWSFRKVGDWMDGCGCRLTPELFQEWKDGCEKEGEFELKEEEEEEVK